ncbi:MAG: ribosomal subunit interface protein [Candidatus Colwellbacteria bacterium RIFCSPHIGHO2_12_FULL_44_17]|uniref:Ribosomal subunit interface protein n=1 Tax=Candidatus Colwellbacteria bacterium RIFCSPHIGHO2_12_FULL_44_17 TaxID=1797689 RepID=A0A1G1Z240_9BACT|nr:MAG: ribosomal subunit interface protein [Candidatus Colwellbacteria bacterium RIFCSPHIGHO2_12_FULL_44_17]
MNITIQATNFELTEAIKIYIHEKFDAFSRVLERWEKEGPLELKVEVAKTTQHHRHGDVFYAEVTLILPGKTLRAQDTEPDLHKAIDRVKDILHEEIKKYKDKQTV